jgi:hypothetical protein
MPEKIMALCIECEKYIDKICESSSGPTHLTKLIIALNEGQNKLGELRGKVIKASYKIKKY